MEKTYMIISWNYIDFADAAYGRLLEIFVGSHEDAITAAREYVPTHSPVGIVEEIV